jgi:diketogulonate reductase-like aldo/keto reductase
MISERLCLGTGELLKNNIKERLKVFKAFADDNGKFVDTAKVYYDGKALKIIKGIKKKYSLIAKISYLEKDKNIPINKKLEEYKKISGYKEINFLLTHWSNNKITKKNINDIWNLKKNRLVNFIGLGNPSLDEIKKFYEYTNKNLDAVQIEYNIFNSFFQKKILDFCIKKNIKLFGYSPLKWCKFKTLNYKSKKIIKQIRKKYKINFYEISLLFSMYKNVIPVVSIKNLYRYNRIKKLETLLGNNFLKKKIFILEKSMKCFKTVSSNKIWYFIDSKLISLKKINLEKKSLAIVKREIKRNNLILKPVLLQKRKEKFIVLDGKIRCKSLYELNMKIKAIIL